MNLFEINIKPKSGTLKPYSTEKIIIDFISYKIGDLENIRIPCYIEDMITPLFLDLQGTVKGPSILFSLRENDDIK